MIKVQVKSIFVISVTVYFAKYAMLCHIFCNRFHKSAITDKTESGGA